MEYRVATVAQLGQMLTAWRKRRNLTQAQLGELLGVAQNSVSTMESRPGSVNVARLFALLSVLELDLVLKERPAQLDSGPDQW